MGVGVGGWVGGGGVRPDVINTVVLDLKGHPRTFTAMSPPVFGLSADTRTAALPFDTSSIS